jgi:hypothetical protein
MHVKDQQVLAMIDSIANHFNTNLNNRYLRQALIIMTLDSQSWSLIESVTEKAEYYKYQGYHYDELYDRIMALAKFIYHARKEIQPSLRTILTRVGTPGEFRASGTDRVIRDMSVNNFGYNVNILSDLVNKLYQRVVELDMEEHRFETPVYKRTTGLTELGRFLVPR